ncbi:MAG: hypothetical protein ACI9TY_001366 [Alphaproteobacteria bacterium]|jgi:hypothetical protein
MYTSILKTIIVMLLVASCASTKKETTIHQDLNTTAVCTAETVEPVRINASDSVDGMVSKGSGIWLDTPYGDNIFITNAHLIKNTIMNSNGTVKSRKIYKKIYVIDSQGMKVQVKVIAHRQLMQTKNNLENYSFTVHKMADIAILVAVDEIPVNFKASKHRLAIKSKNTNAYLGGFSSLSKDDLTKYKSKNTRVQHCTYSLHDKTAIYLHENMHGAYNGSSGTAIIDDDGYIQGLVTVGNNSQEGERNHVHQNKDGSIYISFANKASNIPQLKLYAIGTNHHEIRKLLHETFKNNNND